MAFAPTARRLALLPTVPRLALAPTAPRLARGRTHPNWTDPASIAKAAAKTASAPHKLKIKVATKNKRTLRPGEADVLPDGLMRGEAARLLRTRLHRADAAADKDDHTLLAELRAREYRVRGVVDGEIVGKRIYLPNFKCRMVMNSTPKGHAYNPFEATFRFPPSITKLDIRGYLHAVYGLDVTYIRTVIYDGWNSKRVDKKRQRRGLRVFPTYKRVTVGIKEPFYYPLMVEDMSKEEREAQVDAWEKQFHPRERREMYQTTMKRHLFGVGHHADVPGRREILERVQKRREERESAIQKKLEVIRYDRVQRETASP
ncbi:hypothetical protein EXIGLDRAFT_84821 [Exidia glandulosa HHB12029]|uniref:Large ribosomal subunit protein uL23m n=1 Tax=Exidia glandulosa HHB12029 TaxID=1314781 RepID=A0A165HIQ2_EXIGL|nr:hypothetical protein EXIGLDRAFT_84821 [Exidia glandulosa HHB12029]